MEVQDPNPFLKKKKYPETGKGWKQRLLGLTVEPCLPAFPVIPAGPQTPPGPLPHPHLPLGTWALYSHCLLWHSPCTERHVGEPWAVTGPPLRGDGPPKSHLLTTLPGPLRLPPVGAGATPGRDGEDGRPGAGGPWFGRSRVGQGEGRGSAWGRRARWVPLVESPRSR